MAKDISQLFSEVIERNQHLLAKPIIRDLPNITEEDRKTLNSIINQLSVSQNPQQKVKLEETLRKYTGQLWQIITVLQTPELYGDIFITTKNKPFFYWIGRVGYNY